MNVRKSRLARRRRGAENPVGMDENNIGTQVLEAAINAHRELGPGLLETVYEVILARELCDHGLREWTGRRESPAETQGRGGILNENQKRPLRPGASAG